MTTAIDKNPALIRDRAPCETKTMIHAFFCASGKKLATVLMSSFFLFLKLFERKNKRRFSTKKPYSSLKSGGALAVGTRQKSRPPMGSVGHARATARCCLYLFVCMGRRNGASVLAACQPFALAHKGHSFFFFLVPMYFQCATLTRLSFCNGFFFAIVIVFCCFCVGVFHFVR
ncbi:hypothetical protein TW95_gp1044 [Pandoravirus inopinatum]|uniref:Transmembrane protein n=1 Tax=Pandoravirus inopinatum TaxID=1605721 RepID=A0A0B5IY75_9VIRU|nr:hypothetical protein TW95_gp1044 [Pandoravirus inopinatum]AJF97778.1 hypothetical protein [Pandoravirus inopinatum]